MKILKIWDADYPWDVRVEKVMRSLKDAGHEVHLVARNNKHSPIEEVLPEGTVHRLRPWRILPRKVDGVAQFPAFMNPRWFARMVEVGRRIDADLVLVRDLPLAPTAAAAARVLGVPVVLDMAENYPAMIRDIWLGGRQGPLDVLVRNPRLVSAVERRTLPAMDHVLVVVEESGSRIELLGVDPDRITVVSNTPLSERIPETPVQVDPSRDTLRMVYLGLLEKPRGIETVLEGMALLRERGVRVFADIIGGGMDEELFHAAARRLELGPDHVHFHGMLPYDEALAFFHRTDVGLVPHFAVESCSTTIPNKLFDYMSYGLPVITSDMPPAARIVHEIGSGAVFRSEDAEDFARAVESLTDGEHRRRCGINGRRAIESRYNWDEDARRLVEALESTAARERRPGRVGA